MSQIKNGGLDQYGAEPFNHQQFGTAGIEGVKAAWSHVTKCATSGEQKLSVVKVYSSSSSR